MADSESNKVTRPEFLDRAEADKALAEAKKALAEAAVFETTARKLAAEAEAAEHLAYAKSIEREDADFKHRQSLAVDGRHFVYNFNSAVEETSVTNCRKALTEWERMAEEPITVTLRINSPGGGIFEGFALVDYIEGMQDRGHTVNTHAYGMAASMGGVLLQSGTKRLMGKSAAILIHEASFRTGGKTGDVEDEIVLVHMLQDRILDMYVTRAAGSGASHPMTRANLRKNWARRDWWINANDSLKYGFVDEIA